MQTEPDGIKEFDIYDRLQTVNECMTVGRTVGRRPKMKEEHITVLLDMLSVFIKDIRERTHQKPPRKREIQTLVQSVQWVGRVRKYYIGKEKEE